jgi:hypothetical protein
VASAGIKIGYECGRRGGREEMETIAVDFGHAEQHSVRVPPGIVRIHCVNVSPRTLANGRALM